MDAHLFQQGCFPRPQLQSQRSFRVAVDEANALKPSQRRKLQKNLQRGFVGSVDGVGILRSISVKYNTAVSYENDEYYCTLMFGVDIG